MEIKCKYFCFKINTENGWSSNESISWWDRECVCVWSFNWSGNYVIFEIFFIYSEIEWRNIRWSANSTEPDKNKTRKSIKRYYVERENLVSSETRAEREKESEKDRERTREKVIEFVCVCAPVLCWHLSATQHIFFIVFFFGVPDSRRTKEVSDCLFPFALCSACAFLLLHRRYSTLVMWCACNFELDKWFFFLRWSFSPSPFSIGRMDLSNWESRRKTI